MFRNGRSVIGVAAIFFEIALAIFIAVVLFTQAFSVGDAQVKVMRHDSMTVTYDNAGRATYYYVMVDPDTKVQYVINSDGGMCPRYRKDGSIFGVEEEGI